MEINIALAFDKNYFSNFFPLAQSILLNNSTSEINFHIISNELSLKEQEQITKFVSKNNVVFYKVDTHIISSFITEKKWTYAVYFKLFFPLLLKKTSILKILYLDMDTLVLKSLKDLFNTNLEGYILGAVYDNYVQNQPLIGINNKGDYFNSGVMLINVSEWNNMSISEKVFEYLKRYPENIKYVDQCGLNAVLKNKWKKLPYVYNVLYSYIPKGLSKSEIKTFMEDKYIIHYTLQRPWEMLCDNRARIYYKKYVELSGNKFKYTDFSWNKMLKYLNIRIKEFYLDSAILKYLWQHYKKFISLFDGFNF